MISLITSTSNPIRVLYYAARQCTTYKPEKYSSIDIEEAKKIVQQCLQSGHDSILEHISFTFRIDGISRNCSHQLVRHRLASYSQVSQRYFNQEKADVVYPHTISVNPDLKQKYDELIKHSKEFYAYAIQNGIAKEDARFGLTESTSTALIMTMNARELIHFFKLRCCFRSQWEIRNLANGLLQFCKQKLPLVFDNVGPKCLMDGGCTETKKCKHYNKETNMCNPVENVSSMQVEKMDEKQANQLPTIPKINSFGIKSIYND